MFLSYPHLTHLTQLKKSYICNMPTINKRAKQSPQRDNNNHQGRSYYHSGYQTKQWRAMRRDILQSQPLCVECGKQGRLTVANVIDHIKPVRLGGEFWDTKNMQPLCTPCHNSKSAKERHGNPVGGEKSLHEGHKTAGHSFSHPRENKLDKK